MITLNHKTIFIIGAAFLLPFVMVAAFLGQSLLMLLPVLLFVLFYLIQYPQALLYLLLFSIPWSTEYNFSVDLGTDLPDEPLMLLLAIATSCMIVFHYKALFSKGIFHPLLLLLLLQAGWLVLTVMLSSYPILSIKYFLAKSWYLLAFVAAPLLLWRDEKLFKNSAIILLASMLSVTALTLYRHAEFGFTFGTINLALKPFFRNHVNYSALLVCMLPLQVVCLQQAKTKTIRRLILFSFLITVPALYFSFARGAWLAAITGLAAYGLLKKKWLFQSFVVAVISVIAFVFWLRHDNRYLKFAHDYQSTVFHHNFGDHLEATYQLKDLSTAERFHRWIAAVRMVEDSWQTGFGPSTFYRNYNSYTVPAFKTWVSRNEEQSTVHNYFLLLLIEQGIIGLILFLCLLAAIFWYAQKIFHRTTNAFWKQSVAAITVVLVMQCTLNFLSDLVETDKVGSVFYLCIAALIIADVKTREVSRHRFTS